jgi:hypothetical protein
MHGRAVALFDFARENDNELPLVEGQVILVSYRHGQGWLVAQDPKTGESGLVPEEYVRLLKDIEGGWHGLMNGGAEVESAGGGSTTAMDFTTDVKTPTQLEQVGQNHKRDIPAAQQGDFYPPVVSTFSTSREDLEPWPHREHLLGNQVQTPTSAEGFPRRPSQDVGKEDDEMDVDEGDDEREIIEGKHDFAASDTPSSKTTRGGLHARDHSMAQY